MLHRDMPFGLARHRGLAEPFIDPQPQPRGYTSPRRSSHSKSSSLASNPPSSSRRELRNAPIPSGALPEDVIVIVFGHLSVADIMTIRRCCRWFKHLTEDRRLWQSFLLHPALPVPACTTQLSSLSARALEAQVRRQFVLSQTWAPKPQPGSFIRVSSSRQFAMPNNESLIAISSMDAWVAVASDLGGVYVCAPFGEQSVAGVTWVRVLAAPCEITKLRVVVWSESEGERVAILWTGKVSAQGTPISYHCGLVSALSQDLYAAQMRAQGGILLDSSDFVTAATLDLRNSASEIMDIAIGERYCAVVDAAHIFQVFLHRTPENGMSVPPSSFQGPHRSSRKTISLQFLSHDQLLVYSDSFVAVYKPVSQISTTMESKYWTRVPSTSYFGLLTQHRSSSINLSVHNSTPILALGSDGNELVHFDLRLSGTDAEDVDTTNYGLSLRRSISYMKLGRSLQPFAMGTINGGHSRLVWITPSRNVLFGIALGRKCVNSNNPFTSHQSPLIGTALDLGEYGGLVNERPTLGALFVFHEGEGKLLGGQRGSPDLVMLEY